ncbi:TetR/AcrR family transcriptional regulator [Parachryseolinea silvisoli]|jgi:AcrR family transcriptional regulator|uniref:TetR/AcrR family transcriptional regulator n=1 Tax=Parachryseolinea silvisoli TaxID=2873601 RepID=UPI0022659B45|nr:TetR family transcriptional regulator [Parachryseolinea silvisoli]
MMAKKKQENPEAKDLSTEEKIKEAAREVFTKKGYAATRTRDIAEAAGLNLALLNYYFRSKEKLFEIVMMEKVQALFGIIAPVINDPDTTLQEKMERIVHTYLDMLTNNPDLPLFVLGELRYQPEEFARKLGVAKLLRESALVQQLRERKKNIHPIHFIMNILGMTLFPFIGRPVFQHGAGLSQKEFEALMEERRKLIPKWAEAILSIR